MPMNLKESGHGIRGTHEEQRQDRRQFLKALAVAGTAAGVMSLFPAVDLRAAGQTEALLLSCMDFRLVDDTARYMKTRGLTGKYDHIILAGAALGALTEKFPAWNQTFLDHVSVAIDLHKIQKVMVLDHRDCGAYKVILGQDFAKDPAKETAIHAEQLKQLRKMIQAKYPTLAVELLLMALNGKVEVIS
jgi:carbonic anhydrase